MLLFQRRDSRLGVRVVGVRGGREDGLKLESTSGFDCARTRDVSRVVIEPTTEANRRHVGSAYYLYISYSKTTNLFQWFHSQLSQLDMPLLACLPVPPPSICLLGNLQTALVHKLIDAYPRTRRERLYATSPTPSRCYAPARLALPFQAQADQRELQSDGHQM